MNLIDESCKIINYGTYDDINNELFICKLHNEYNGYDITSISDISNISILEHSNIVIRSELKSKYPLVECNNKKLAYCSKYLTHKIYHDYIYISGNYRAWLEWYNQSGGNGKPSTIDTIHDDILYADYIRVFTTDIPVQMRKVSVEFITNIITFIELSKTRSFSIIYNIHLIDNGFNFIKNGKIPTEFIDAVEYNAIDKDCVEILPLTTAIKYVITADIMTWMTFFVKDHSQNINDILSDVRDEIFTIAHT